MKYVKLFNNHSEYQTYINNEPILPNLSYCKDADDCHYTNIETKLVLTFNSSTIKIFGLDAGYIFNNTFNSVEVDGVNITASDLDIWNNYDTTEGTHVVKYDLKDNSIIPASLFYGCNCISAFIPDSVEIIDYTAFGYSSITHVTLNINTVQQVNCAFAGCSLDSETLNILNTYYPGWNVCD